jgi:signal transduction histidine kinase/ligand-binding sensor domain-containing protein
MIAAVGYTIRVLIIILITGCGLKAQSFNPRYNFNQLNVQNGLTQNIVYHFLQDSRGYMWIGTHNGISLYDGIRTINFLHNEQDKTSISGNFITCILEDSAQQVWIGTEAGMDRYNRASNAFSHFGVDRPDGTKENTYCVPLGFLSATTLWFLDTKTKSIRSLNTKTGTTSFIAELKANHALFYKSDATKSVHIWSTYDKGTIHQLFRDSRLIGQQTFFAGKNDPLKNPVFEVNHVLQQNDTTAWLSTNEGLVKLNPVLNKYRLFNRWQNQIVKEFRYAALSPKGQLWVGSGPGGIYTFDVNTLQFIDNFRNDKLDPFSLCSDNIVSLYFDQTGNIWCGSFGNGSSYSHIENIFFANHLSKNETQAWKANNSISWIGMDPHENLWCILADAPGFWILDKEFKIRVHQNPLLENGANFNGSIYKIIFGPGVEIWCATNKGLYQYNVRTNRMHPLKYELINQDLQGSIWITDIAGLGDSSILFSTYAGLYRVTNESGRLVVKPFTFLQPGEYNGFGPIFQDQANFVYIKTLGDFLYVLKPAPGEMGYTLIKKIHFLPEINHYFNEKGDTITYLATKDGLYHIDNRNFQIEKEGFNNQLPFLNVSSVFKKDHQLWVFGEKGLYFFDEKNKSRRTFTVEDGLPTNEFSLSALVYTGDERCIAGSSNGLVSFFPGQRPDSVYPPRAQITNIYINDVVYNPFRHPDETKRISLSHRENTFSFDFAPIAFQHAAQCSFEYKLKGYDEAWINSGTTRYTRYSKIPQGNYVFDLRILDATGRVSPFTKTLEIQIAQAFWQTTLFKAAVGAFIVLGGWLLFRWYFSNKIRKQKREFEKQQAIERERTRIATDMHDDLGAGLSRIKFLSQVLQNKEGNDESIKTELEKITRYSDEMAEKMGEIVWAMNEKNDTLADLVAYTRSYAVEYLANHDIPCEADTPSHLPVTFIPGDVRRNIFLSVKECLHNIVKHAGATRVFFSVQLGGMIQIIIHDNGKGIDWNNRRAFSNGIQNIQQRMKEIGGEVQFSNEGGTKVILTIH